MKKKWSQIFSFKQAHPDASEREISKSLDIPRSSVNYNKTRVKRNTPYNESIFWESEAGQLFIKRLVISTIYNFAIKGGVGADRISDFLKQLRLQTHVGVSSSSILRTIREVECQILLYKNLKEKELKTLAGEQKDYLKVVLGLDETWLDEMLLVCQELSSGYLFLKKAVEKETAKAGGRSLKSE